MFAQCVVITVIFFVLSMGFILTKKKRWALMALPLGFLPFVNVVFGIIYKFFLKRDYDDMAAIIVLTAAAIISCSLLGMLTVQFIRSKKTRSLYIIVGIVFNAILSIILLRYYVI